MQGTPLHTPSGILQKSIRGGIWLTIGYGAEKLLGAISFFILARFLTPADFGIMTFILLVPKFLQSATETGFSAAAIQKEGDIRAYLNPIWTIGVLKGVAIAASVFILGPMIAAFLHVPEASLAIRLGGIFMLVYQLGNIGEIYFFKELNFKKVFYRNLWRQLAYVTTTLLFIPLAHNYWALAVGTLALYLTEAISTYWLHPYRPWLSFQFSRLKELFGFSKWMIGQGYLRQAYAFLEQTVVGRLTNTTAFGLYTKAKSVASIAPGFLSSVITIVSFPAYAKIKEAPNKVKDGLLKSFDLFFAFVIPVAFLVLAAGGKLILIFLGDAWLPMTAAFRLLLFFFVAHTIIDLSYSLFNGLGRPDKKVKYEAIKLPLTIILLYFLTRQSGIEGAAVALMIGATPILLLCLIDLRRLTGANYSAILSTILIPLLLSLLLSLPLFLFKDAILALGTVFFVTLTTLVGLVYLLAIYWLGTRWKLGPYKTLRLLWQYVR